MTLQQMARKLRATADAIDELLGVDRPTANEHPATKKKLLESLKGKKKPAKAKKLHWKTREKMEREAQAKAS